MPGERRRAASSSMSRNSTRDSSRSSRSGWFGASPRKSVHGMTNTSASSSPWPPDPLLEPPGPGGDVGPHIAGPDGGATFHQTQVDAVQPEHVDEREDVLVLEEPERIVGARQLHGRGFSEAD